MAGLKLAGLLAVVWFGGFPLCTWVVCGRAPFQYPGGNPATTASPQTLLSPSRASAEQYAFVACAFLSVLAAVREMYRQMELAMAEVFGDTIRDPGSMRKRDRQTRSGKSDSRDHTRAAPAAIKCSRKDELMKSVQSENVVSAKTGVSVSSWPPPPLEQAGDTAPPDAPSPVQAPVAPSASATGMSFHQWRKEKEKKARAAEKRRCQWRLKSEMIRSEMLESQMLMADLAAQQLACAAQSETLTAYKQENARRDIHGKKLQSVYAGKFHE